MQLRERGTKMLAGLTASLGKSTPRLVCPLRKRVAVPTADGSLTYASLLQHIDDESLKAVIRAEAGPLAVNVQDRSNGRVAWQVILRECQEPASALHINTKILEYNGLTMPKDVGITEASVTDFNRLIVKKNADLPIANRFNDDSMTEKLLGAIIIPPTIAQIADMLLQCPTANRDARFYTQPVAAAGGGPAVPGRWIRRAVVQHLDELWRAAFKRGELKFAAPTSRPTRTGPSNHADGMDIRCNGTVTGPVPESKQAKHPQTVLFL